MVVVSGILLNKRFLREHAAITKNFISLKNLPSYAKHEAIYIEQDINGTMPLWKIIWTSYFIYPEITENLPVKKSVTNQYSNSVPDNALILIEKPTPWYVPTKVVLKKIIWENEYYVLGSICNARECLLNNADKLSHLAFSDTDYEDSILMKGWSVKEPDSRWATSKETTARLVAGDHEVTFLILEALSLDKNQSVTVFVNEKSIGKKQLSLEWETYTFELLERAQNEVLNIKFVFDKVYNPAQMGISQDTRDLTVNFKRIELK